MEIRTLRATEREAFLDLVDGWDLEDGWAGRDFFRRFIEIDPTYADENVFVAVDSGRLVSCLQVFPRTVRLAGCEVPTAGIGTVFTTRERRGEGLAGRLLSHAAAAMTVRGFELSLLFGDPAFYTERGWTSFPNRPTLLRAAQRDGGGDAAAGTPGIDLRPFDRSRDLEAVQRVAAGFRASRSGTVVRDEALFDASLRLAGNPAEEFEVALRDGDLVAYLRMARFEEQLVATELARTDSSPDALAALIRAALSPRAASLLLPAFDDLPLTVALESCGLSSRQRVEPDNMLRCLDPAALCRRLQLPLAPGERPIDYLLRVMQPEGFVFFPADRF